VIPCTQDQAARAKCLPENHQTTLNGMKTSRKSRGAKVTVTDITNTITVITTASTTLTAAIAKNTIQNAKATSQARRKRKRAAATRTRRSHAQREIRNLAVILKAKISATAVVHAVQAGKPERNAVLQETANVTVAVAQRVLRVLRVKKVHLQRNQAVRKIRLSKLNRAAQ